MANQCNIQDMIKPIYSQDYLGTETGMEYEIIYDDLANKSSLQLECNPVYKKVPVLLHNGTPISESLVILEYTDETWSTNTRFLPDDPFARATVNFWAKLKTFSTYVNHQSLFFAMIIN
ncbi:probable glutathione S-transferase [Tanacetum coccineum]